MFSSLGSVLLLTVDRYIFITQPLRYNVFVTLPRAIYLTLASTLIAAAGAVWYSFSVTLPWDLVCTFTHVLPLSMVIFWNVLFFLTYFAMHIMYLVILVIALKHKKRIEQTKSPSTSTTNMTVLRRDGSTFSLDPSVSTVTGEEEARKRAAATAKSRRKSASEVVINMLKESSQVHATFKTIRYIVLLLLIYSLVELPVVAVAIEDMIDHLGWNNGDGLGGTKCGEDLSSIPLPWEERTRLTMLQCMETFISGTAVCCLLESRVPLVELPMCHMAAESSHALHLTRIFTMSLLGWIANALADPIVYAFWYPVFRKNLVKLILKVKEKVAYGERSDITPGVFGIS